MLKTLSSLAAGLFLSVAVWAAPTVEMMTSMGKITIELYPEKAPQTVNAFLENVRSGFYNGTIFHRVINGFMIQGGGFVIQNDGNQKALKEKEVKTPKLQNEATNGLKNDRGTLAMARTSDPHSARVQFFINHKDNGFLNHQTPNDPHGWGYAVFGKVTQGMNVVDEIAKVRTGNFAGYDDVPQVPVMIESIKIIPENVKATQKNARTASEK